MPSSKQTHRWIWYFVIVALLGLTAGITMIVYNLRLQLKPEQLSAARKLWEEKGHRSYVLTYHVKKSDGADDRFVVKVHQGKVAEALINGRPETPDRFRYYGMEALFEYVEGFLALASQKDQPRTYLRAIFDADTGGLRKFVRRVMAKTERVEIVVDSLEAR